MVNVVGLQMMKANEVSDAETRIAELQATLDALRNAKVGKNHRMGKPSAGRKYVLLSKKMSSWGRVPKQQADLADLLAQNFEVGKEYTEAEVFNALVDQSGNYDSLCKAVQDPTYLFRYYRGLKNDGKYAGFVARNFIKQIG